MNEFSRASVAFAESLKDRSFPSRFESILTLTEIKSICGIPVKRVRWDCTSGLVSVITVKDMEYRELYSGTMMPRDRNGNVLLDNDSINIRKNWGFDTICYNLYRLMEHLKLLEVDQFGLLKSVYQKSLEQKFIEQYFPAH